MEGPWASVDALKEEIEEKSRDLTAFSEARGMIRRRVLEVQDSKSQLTPLPMWSGTDAVLGSLDLSIHAMERTLEELRQLLTQAEERERPKLTLIDGGAT
jgi:hypothetical protein